jgi:hypothetical protein
MEPTQTLIPGYANARATRAYAEEHPAAAHCLGLLYKL